MRLKAAIVLSALVAVVGTTSSFAQLKVTADTPRWRIFFADPVSVDVSDMPLDAVENLHRTGTPPKVDMSAWRLTVDGPGLANSSL